MNKLETIQQKGLLNDVWVVDENKGNGYHRYIISEKDNTTWTCGNNTIGIFAELYFQDGPRDLESSRYGVLDQDLLEIVRHRLTAFQEGDLSNEYTEEALYHITKALEALNRRIEDRLDRGVLGTYNK